MCISETYVTYSKDNFAQKTTLAAKQTYCRCFGACAGMIAVHHPKDCWRKLHSLRYMADSSDMQDAMFFFRRLLLGNNDSFPLQTDQLLRVTEPATRATRASVSALRRSALAQGLGRVVKSGVTWFGGLRSKARRFRCRAKTQGGCVWGLAWRVSALAHAWRRSSRSFRPVGEKTGLTAE